tara:strand:+ start:22629 stop:23156 length:528 start_codon:yes stop_codon:yes gene_type:complete
MKKTILIIFLGFFISLSSQAEDNLWNILNHKETGQTYIYLQSEESATNNILIHCSLIEGYKEQSNLPIIVGFKDPAKIAYIKGYFKESGNDIKIESIPITNNSEDKEYFRDHTLITNHFYLAEFKSLKVFYTTKNNELPDSLTFKINRDDFIKSTYRCLQTAFFSDLSNKQKNKD